MDTTAFAAIISSVPFVSAPVAPRNWRGDMGVFMSNVPDVEVGGHPDLVLSFMYPRYSVRFPKFAAQIRDFWRARHSMDVLLSWMDDAKFGLTKTQILQSRVELCRNGFRPCEWLSAKPPLSPQDDAIGTLTLVKPMLDLFLTADCISRYCVGGELDLWNTFDSLQTMTNYIAPRVKKNKRTLGVHFSTNRADWRPNHPGSTFAEYWNQQINKLDELWFQSHPTCNDTDLVNAIIPILDRFAGNFGVTPDRGDGLPFSCVAVETSLQAMFDGSCDQAECDRRGRITLSVPPSSGPAGLVSVMGSCNGQ